MDYYQRRQDAIRQIVILKNEGKKDKEIIGRLGYGLGLPPKTIIKLIEQAGMLPKGKAEQEAVSKKEAEKEAEEALNGISQ
jgi:hypothetical protein